MSRAINGVLLVAAFLCLTVAAPKAQTTSSSSDTKAFEVLEVDGNNLVVRLPDGTKEMTVPDDFRFTVNGQQLSVHQLKVGMKGTATVTTRTTVTPVTVTEVKNGTVVVRSGGGIIVRTDEGVKSFSQGEVDKRGVKIVRDGKVVQLSELRENDRLSATIITSLPPKVVTEREVNATLAAAGGGSAASAAAPARSSGTTASAGSTRQAGASSSASAASQSSGGASPARAGTLPKTASSWPLLALASALLLAMGLTLTIRRRLVR